MKIQKNPKTNTLDIYKALKPKLEQYKNNPVAFAKDVFGVTLDPWQEEMLQNVNDYQKVAVAGATGLGKGFASALAIWWFISTKVDIVDGQLKFPKLMVTGPEEGVLKNGVWAQLTELHRKSPLMQLLFNVTATKIYMKGADKEWFCVLKTTSARYSASGDAQAESLQGFHANWTLVLIDEGSSLQRANIDAILGSAISPQRKIVMTFNPLRDDGFAYLVYNDKRYGDAWQKMNISFYDVPRLCNDPHARAERESWIKTYGLNSTYVQARVFGQFPTAATTNRVFSQQEVKDARERNKILEDDDTKYLQLGIDISRFGCVTPDTEVLTYNGWKFIQDVTINEKVMILHGDNAEWGNCNKIIKKDFDGLLNVYDGEKISFAYTPNHGIIARSPRSKNYVTKKLSELPNEFLIRRSNSWVGNEHDIKTFTFKRKMPHGGYHIRKWEFDYKDWCEFVGWFVAEGNVYKDKKNQYRVMIAQYPGKKRNHLNALLVKMGIKFKWKNTNQIEFSNKEIGKWLIEHCGHGASNKKIPKEIMESNIESIDRFLLGYGLGDGHTKKIGTTIYSTTSKILADQVQELLCKLGVAGKLSKKQAAGSTSYINGRKITRQYDIYSITQKIRQYDSDVLKKKIKQIPYKGLVYCLSTDTGNFLMRRNGLTCWTGNSDETVYYVRRGLKSLEMLCESKTSAPQIVARAIELAQKWTPEGKDPKKHTLIILDEVGVGGGPVDYLLEQGWIIAGVHNGSSPTLPEDYRILIDELWMEDGKNAIRECGLIDDDILVQQLLSRTYCFTGKARQRRISTKDEMKAKKLDSPDRADAFILAFTDPDKLHLQSINIRSTIDFF